MLTGAAQARVDLAQAVAQRMLSSSTPPSNGFSSRLKAPICAA
jgi:hypothetical protein